MRSTYITKASDITRKWYVVDAEGLTLGRLSTEVARILRGKHKVIYTPNLDTGDHVIIVNAEKIKVTGRKLDKKMYVRYSGYIGGRKETPLRVMLSKKPEEVLRHSIKGMLPKGALGRQMFKKLHVYAGAEHKNQAQKPEELKIKA